MRSAEDFETRLTSGEKRNRKRMAQVATVYTLAPWVLSAADVLHTLRPDNLDALRPRPRPLAAIPIAKSLRGMIASHHLDATAAAPVIKCANYLEAILRLRALRTSGDFDDYWQFHLAKELERVHRPRYASGTIPNPLPRERPRLRLVK